MPRKILLGLLLLIPFAFGFVIYFDKDQSVVEQVYVFPDAGRQPWLHAIEDARENIRLAAYRLSDPLIIAELLKAASKGIHVTLMIEPSPVNHERSENIAFNMSNQSNIDVYHPAPPIKQTHQKLIIVDERWAMAGTGNLDQESFEGIRDNSGHFIEKPSRDFSIVVTDQEKLKNMISVFDADIHGQTVSPSDPQLIWGPSPQQKQYFLEMILGAKQSIQLYQQSIQDDEIANALVDAAKRGVKVELLMMPFPFGKKSDPNIPHQEILRAAGGKVYLKDHLYIHAKVMIIDGKYMTIGSINFYAPSFENNRELTVLTHDPVEIKTVLTVFERDKNAY